MLNEVLRLTRKRTNSIEPLHVKEKYLKTSCYGCKFNDSDMDENERKAHCFSCLEPITVRKNYVIKE